VVQILRTPEAYGDLEEIWQYLASEGSEAVADGMLDLFEARCSLLSDFPEMGRQRPEFGSSVRSLSVGSYLIFYRPFKDGIEVLRVLHGAQDIRSL
jgi:toxin ParE1/3/4